MILPVITLMPVDEARGRDAADHVGEVENRRRDRRRGGSNLIGPDGSEVAIADKRDRP